MSRAIREMCGHVTTKQCADTRQKQDRKNNTHVPVMRVLVYYPVRETRMAKAVSSGETSVSRPKNEG